MYVLEYIEAPSAQTCRGWESSCERSLQSPLLTSVIDGPMVLNCRGRTMSTTRHEVLGGAAVKERRELLEQTPLRERAQAQKFPLNS